MKKMLMALLCVLALCLLCAGVVADETVGDWKVRLDGNAATITGYTGSDTEITIPGTVTVDGTNYPVNTIGQGAFMYCRSLINIAIPNGVTSIGENVFYGCSGLTSVTIPNSVTSIGKYAFYGCTGLTSVTIPNRVTSIGNSAFDGCSGLTSVTIPNSVTSIGKFAFSGCSGLTSVTIPNSVTSISDYAFLYCTCLTDVTIPDSVTSIGNSVFTGCSKLTSVTIPNSVTSIGENVFYGCSGLTSVTIPNSVTSIGDSAFESCSKLTSITIPNSVTSIGHYAFDGCSGLTSVTIPNSVINIGAYAFYDCTSLSDIYCTYPQTLWQYVKKGQNWNSNNPVNQTIHFDSNWYVLTFDANGGTGFMRPLAVSVNSPQGTIPVCAFTPPEGMALNGWEIGTDETSWTTYDITRPVVTISRDSIARAVWAETRVRTAVYPAGAGSVTYDMPAGSFTVEPSPGYEFLGWQYADEHGFGPIDYVSTTPTYVPSPVKDGTYTAFLKAIPYAITVNAVGNGSASASLSEAVVGKTITLTAEPEEGYRFREWQITPDTVTVTDNTFIMPASDVTVTGVFAPEAWPVTAQNCYVTLENDSTRLSQAAPGATLTVCWDYENQPEGQYWTGGFTVNGEALPDGTYTFIMPDEEVVVTAVYIPQETVTIDLSDGFDTAPVSAVYKCGTADFDEESESYRLDVNGDEVFDLKLLPQEENNDVLLIPLQGMTALSPSYTVDLSDQHGQYGQVIFHFDPRFGPADFTLPADLTAIEANAFEGDISITSVDAKNCISIGTEAFSGCTGLTQIRVHPDCQIDSTAFTGCGTVFVFAPASGAAEACCEGLTNVLFVEESQN